MWKRKRFLIGGLIILLAVGSLSFMAFKGAATYYYTVSEVISQASALQGQNIRVAGKVTPNSIQNGSTNNTLRFTLMDSSDNNNRISIIYQGGVPDSFKESNDAVVEGHLTASGIFEAQQIIVKCPSKYEPKE